jgi:type IV secretion system protein VirB6
MIAGCPVPATGGAFLSGLLTHIDCQAQNIGAGGYQALAAPGSSMALVVSGLLTLFVALFGIRMMMGHAPGIRDGVIAVVKIGVVLLLATSWPAYRVIAYDVVLRGPAELAAAIGQPAGLPGAGGALVPRLQNADDMMLALGQLGTGTEVDVERAPPPGEPAASLRKSSGIGDDFAFGTARVAYLAGTVGALAIVRLIAGLLLALAPLFAGLLLFEATRALFVGWLRGLVAVVIGALGVAVVLGVELALLEPWLADTLSQRYARIPTPSAPAELLVLTLAFAVTLFAAIAAGARLAYAVHVPAPWRETPARIADLLRGANALAPAATGARNSDAAPSRAFVIADAVTSMQRREAAAVTASLSARDSATPRTGSARTGSATGTRDIAVSMPVPLGQSFRRTRTRVSSSATRRDRRP